MYSRYYTRTFAMTKNDSNGERLPLQTLSTPCAFQIFRFDKQTFSQFATQALCELGYNYNYDSTVIPISNPCHFTRNGSPARNETSKEALQIPFKNQSIIFAAGNKICEWNLWSSSAYNNHISPYIIPTR